MLHQNVVNKEKQQEVKRLAGNIPPPFRNVSLVCCVVSFNPAPDVLQEMNHCLINEVLGQPPINQGLISLLNCRLQDGAMLHPGEQPDVSGPAQWNRLHQNSVLRYHWPSVGPPLRAVSRPAPPLQTRLHTQHPHWSLPRSDLALSLLVYTPGRTSSPLHVNRDEKGRT